MKFSKGDRVCVLLVCNKWGVDFTCYVGALVKVEKKGQFANPTAELLVDKYIGLDSKQKHEPRKVVVDIRLFKMLHWNDENKALVKELRKQSKVLHQLTTDIKSIK
jgi:hypothetical protein